MKISIIHATRRPDEAFNAMCQWLLNASMKNSLEYILSIDRFDKGNYDYSKFLSYSGLKTIRNDNRSAVDAFNAGAKVATGNLFVCISDDMECPLNWDIQLLDVLNGKENFYLKVRDGIQPTLVTLPIFDRAYYESIGYVWHPDYRHMFCDQEATAVAIMTGRYIKSDLLFPHAHYTTNQSKKDAVNERNDATWGQGEALFKERLKTNFGIANPVTPYSSIKWK